MTRERWEEIKEKIREHFSVVDEGSTPEGPGVVEFVIFDHSTGKQMKAEWKDHPKKIGEHGIASHRIGSQSHIQVEYSDSERIQTFTMYLLNPAGEWIPTDQVSF